MAIFRQSAANCSKSSVAPRKQKKKTSRPNTLRHHLAPWCVYRAARLCRWRAVRRHWILLRRHCRRPSAPSSAPHLPPPATAAGGVSSAARDFTCQRRGSHLEDIASDERLDALRKFIFVEVRFTVSALSFEVIAKTATTIGAQRDANKPGRLADKPNAIVTCIRSRRRQQPKRSSSQLRPGNPESEPCQKQARHTTSPSHNISPFHTERSHPE